MSRRKTPHGPSRRDFLEQVGAASLAGPLLGAGSAARARLFPTELPARQWTEFAGDGFSVPVSGAIFRGSDPPCCGLPVGGISTGCIDVDARGAYGFSSIFNPVSPCGAVTGWRMPRKPQSMQPLLGLSVAGSTWVLAMPEIINGGEAPVCMEPFFGKAVFKSDRVAVPKLEGVKAAREIYYWGHYPIADLEFDTDAPVGVGLRAWAPLLPGDAAASNIPAAVFEVRLHNGSGTAQNGAIAFNFPGPDLQESRGGVFDRSTVDEDVHGVMVASSGGVSYVLGVIGEEKLRLGAGLSAGPNAWARIAAELPRPSARESPGGRVYEDGSSSAAVDFSLAPGDQKIVRFLLTWYAPVWEGARKRFVESVNARQGGQNPVRWLASKWDGETNYYTQMYAARYDNALEVARRIAAGHKSLLARVLAWQRVIYAEPGLPPWLRDSLINNLCLLTECSVWVQGRPPLGDWAYPNGAYGLIESPRGDPDMACIPCDWYGNVPVVYFYPELALSTLKAFKELQREDGAAPFYIGVLGDLPDFATPSYDWQISLNGTCYVDLADRLWQRTGDDSVLHQYYESVKKCNTMTMNLRKGPGGVISMPEGNKGMEWFEHGDWAGMCAHLGGLHLAQLRMMERMARQMGDKDYVSQCQAWLADGSRAMEDEVWAGDYYLNFYEKESGRKSDDVMGYQLDGEWAARSHGLPGVFRPDRVQKTLKTIQRCNVALTPNAGAANFTRPDGTPLPEKSSIAAYGQYAMFPSELVVLAMTYMYAGQKEFGLDLLRRHWENNALRQKHAWDMPNIVRGDTGERVYGTDYYQDMLLWAVPAALSGTGMHGLCAPGRLVDRVIKAGRPMTR